MKIYNIDLFEKLNINPINIKDLSNTNQLDKSLKITKTDPNAYKYEDLKPGYIVKTNNKEYVWMIFDVKRLHKMYELTKTTYPNTYYKPNDLVMVRKSDNTSTYLSYMDTVTIDMYVYANTFPRHITNINNNIIELYLTNININRFKTLGDFIIFYNKYMTNL